MNSKGGALKEHRHWVCTISQLSMEGKVSFSILSQCQRPCQYLLQNEYMDAARLCLVWVRSSSMYGRMVSIRQQGALRE